MFIRIVIYIVFLVVIPTVFYYLYKIYVERREAVAVVNRSPVAPLWLASLQNNININEPGFGDNFDIELKSIDAFIHYGLIEGGRNGRYSIDTAKYGCLLAKINSNVCLRDDWEVCSDDEGNI
ncbi:MAG: hypothetical protein FWC73_10970 [Defluviitaleaceae bacterium]|nr:hypothetical protein [Defluviitaleaceae bacterium]